MKEISVEESVIRAMDGTSPALFPYLPYILQDSWEIGSDPESIISMMTKLIPEPGKLQLLDLGCGKGVVSVQVAKALGCRCHGIDAIPAFIEEANHKAAEHGVSALCRFEVGDIRSMVNELPPYDVIVLGAIGPVFGDYHQTLTTLKANLHPGGAIIIDDGYIDDHREYTHPLILKQSEMLHQVRNSGMEIVDEIVFDASSVAAGNDLLIDSLNVRCMELAEKYPEKKELFMDYINQQQEESRVLEEEVVCTVMLIRQKS